MCSVSLKHNERESRAHRSGLLQYSALNKITGFNVTSLCAGESDGLGFQRDKPAQWFSPFDNYKKQRIVLFRIFPSTYKMGRSGKEAIPHNYSAYIARSDFSSDALKFKSILAYG